MLAYSLTINYVRPVLENTSGHDTTAQHLLNMDVNLKPFFKNKTGNHVVETGYLLD